jgi:hypothetical protein
MAYTDAFGKGALDEGEYFHKTCQSCRCESDIYETVWTGEDNDFNGVEGWSYCTDCDIETFHPIKKYDKSETPK